jgi:oligoribonuclease
MKFVSIDIETTGLNPDTDDILEVGAVIGDFKSSVPVKDCPTFHCYILKGSYKGNPYALSMHPTILRRIATVEKPYRYITPENFNSHFERFLVDNDIGYSDRSQTKVSFTPAGKNFAAFDLQFLNRHFKFSDYFSVAHRVLDPAILYFDVENDTMLPNTSECMKRAGIEGEVAHTAVEDAQVVVDLLKRKLPYGYEDM